MIHWPKLVLTLHIPAAAVPVTKLFILLQTKAMKIVKFILFLALSLVLGSDGEDVEGSNRLSVPVLKVDGTFVSPVTEFFYEPVSDPSIDCALSSDTEFAPSDFCYYNQTTGEISWLQKQSDTFWQAPILDVSDVDERGLVYIDAVDTGDLLESGGAKANKQIRIEFTLLKNVLSSDYDSLNVSFPLVAFPMQGPLLGTSGVGEVHGTSAFQGLNANGINATGYDGLELVDASSVLSALDSELNVLELNALVYTECARLSIQPTSTALGEFNFTTGSWGTGGLTLGPISMSTEITVSGKITYGYVWNRATVTPGSYRLSFYLDPTCGCKTLITSETEIINRGETYVTDWIDPDDEDTCGGGVYIDIELRGSGGGGSGGGKGGSGGGKGGSGAQGSKKKGVGETYAKKKVRHTRHRRHRRHHRSDHKKPNKKGGLRNHE